MDNMITLDVLSRSVLKTLLYFDLFDYPLTPQEILVHVPDAHVTTRGIISTLDHLTRQSLVFKLGDFYSLKNDPTLEARRRKGNTLAKTYVKKAMRQSWLIAHFPFVEGVMISGSLSKGYADDASDIDFFIVTKPGRLWIARTLLVLYKRLFLFNSHKYFCVNYFVDRDHLEIKEKNIYTATELSTLIPMYGGKVYVDLLTRNPWLKDYFPNFTIRNPSDLSCQENPFFAFKGITEWFFDHCQPDAVDRFFMKLTFRRWKRLYGNYAKADFRLAFKTNRHTSKSHQHNYQKKILARYQERIQSFTTSMRIHSAA